MTIDRMLATWVQNRRNLGFSIVNTHDMEDAKEYMKVSFGRTHLTSTIERSFRKLRSKGVIKVINAKRPFDREARWLIKNVDMSKLR